MKNLSKTGEFNTVLELIQRLTKAAHMLQYHALKEKKSNCGAECVDRGCVNTGLCVTWASMLMIPFG